MILHREDGTTAALLDEYGRAVDDLIRVLGQISDSNYDALVDAEAADPNCRSIRTVMEHVVQAGIAYATYLQQQYQPAADSPTENPSLPTRAEAIVAVRNLLPLTQSVLKAHPNLQWEESVEGKKMLVRWGQRYDPEQLMEHAIVHILRHRRQIERFWTKLILG